MTTDEYITSQAARKKVADYLQPLIDEQKGAWKKGVYAYAYELAANAAGRMWVKEPYNITGALLNGAATWREYSESGNALIYDADIAERLCSPSELKRCKSGERRPNRRESWLDVQARALSQAAQIIIESIPLM